MARDTIGLDHFSGGKNITPTPDDGVDDLAKLLREQQQDAKAHVAVDDTGSPYAALATDVIIGVDTNTAVVTVNLPLAADVPAGKMVIVHDEGGNATANAITIAASGGDSLNGVSSIAADDGRAIFYGDGVSAWYGA